MSRKEQKMICDVCGREIFSFMEDNVSIWEELGMCAVCCFGEADLIDA